MNTRGYRQIATNAIEQSWRGYNENNHGNASVVMGSCLLQIQRPSLLAVLLIPSPTWIEWLEVGSQDRDLGS